jgi:hypothetical protein
LLKAGTKSSHQDEIWAEFSNPDLGVSIAVFLQSKQEQPELNLKTLPKRLIDYRPLAFALSDVSKC